MSYVSTSYAAALTRIAIEDGAPIGDLLVGTGLSPGDLAGPEWRMDSKQFLRLAENAMAVTGDPALGLRFGRSLGILAHGFAGLAALGQTTLAGAATVLVDSIRTRMSVFEVTLGGDDDEVFVDYAPVEAFGSAFVFVMEAALSSVTGMAATLLGVPNPIPGSRLEVEYAKPPHFDRYESFGLVRTVFDCSHNRVVFPAEVLTRELVFASSYTTSHVEEALAREFLALEDTLDVVERVRVLLTGSLARPPSLDTAAQRLGLSNRTLRRRLEQRGTTFQAVLDGLRAEHARRYVAEGTLSLARIAELLGYADAANFRRAFRKWTGVTPTVYRQRGSE